MIGDTGLLSNRLHAASKITVKIIDKLINRLGFFNILEEFQFALQVELEHGTVNGANVTNNHPLFTGVIVLSHLTEDPLYYTRLWPMEVTGEIFTATLHGDTALINGLNDELTKAKHYLQNREKAATPWRI